MSSPNFTTTLTVAQSPHEAFTAINNVRGWWSQQIDGGTEQLGDEFTYRFKDAHRCRVKLVEVVPDKRVVWLVLENYFNFTADESEWQGTKLIFDIAPHGAQTQIRFTHQGLVPDYECFEVCSSAWGSYINGSLRKLIATGKGSPNPREAS